VKRFYLVVSLRVGGGKLEMCKNYRSNDFSRGKDPTNRSQELKEEKADVSELLK